MQTVAQAKTRGTITDGTYRLVTQINTLRAGANILLAADDDSKPISPDNASIYVEWPARQLQLTVAAMKDGNIVAVDSRNKVTMYLIRTKADENDLIRYLTSKLH